MDEDLSSFTADRSARTAELLHRQTRELQDFDLQTAAMGLDLAQIVDSTQDCLQDQDLLVDTDSVRGSMLSLTPSSSRNSFAPFSSAMPANSAL